MSVLEPYKVLTVTHHNLNVQDIGHFYLKGGNEQRVSDGISRLKETFGIDECQYIETCNRVTYLIYKQGPISSDFLESFFQVVNPRLEAVVLGDISRFVTYYEGSEAIQHIFELASSMDSLVVGEREIFRQYRLSYDKCRDLKLVGDNLRLLEKATVNAAKAVYNSTKIGEKPLSIVSLAMAALQKKPLVTPQPRIVLIGAGETNALVGKFLKKYSYTDIKIYNRSLHNAEELSREVGAHSYHINELSNINGAFDIIFICTSANKEVIDEKLYAEMLQGDQSEKIIIDLAVPRNIAPEVVEQHHVDYIDIESLRIISEKNLEARKMEVIKAKPIIEKKLQKFKLHFQQRQIEKALNTVPQAVKAVKSRAIDQVYKDRLADLDDNSKALVMEMMDYMEKKCVSIPIKLAKSVIN